MFIPHSYRQMPGTCICVCECICVFTYHCLIVEGRRRCPRAIRSVRSGPVRPVCPVRAPWGTGADRTDRTGPDRAGTARWPSLAWPCPVRSGPSGPLQCRTPGPDGLDRTGRDPGSPHLFFCLKSDGVLFQNKLLDQK